MGDFKYQVSFYNLFDYVGVEKHLEKMAAKGWRLATIGKFFWIYRREEPAKVKYSVTYIPEVSQFDPKPLEKQRDMEAYCEEAGWKKVDNWMQMQIFCSENSDAVPIETDESLRLETIHKSMKKNMLISHSLLLLVYLMNAFTLFNGAKYDWLSFFSNDNRLWLAGLWLCGTFGVLFDVGYYFYWYRKAKKMVRNEQECPEPRLYRPVMRIFIILLGALFIGLMSSYNKTMAFDMIVYLAGLLAVIMLVRVLQEKIKKWGCSKGINAAFTVVVCVILSFVLVGGTTMFSMVTWNREKKPVRIGSFEVGDIDYAIFYDRIPLYVQDFSKEPYVEDSTRTVREIESILMSTGQYSQTVFIQGEEVERVTGLDYKVITVKANFMYDFALKCFWNQKFIFSEEGEKEKTEYRAVYESDAGTMYREYYDGLPVATEWLVLTENKIIPMTIFLNDLSEEQMKIIIETFAE